MPVPCPEVRAVKYAAPAANATNASAERIIVRDISLSSSADYSAGLLCFPRPNNALIGFGDRREPLVGELLQPLALVRFGRENVAFRVGRDAVDRVELAGLTA